ncbi:hypothetical protein L6452_36838 [Arctium lappa]|uniref:Uncharacterized protein n=1 Tax=Arctium lappa TaxID=4217 RepID=A0ACB8Y212_ARCLA|nr:hypothetical protein L6452_36838 [Arctium lappa]
MITVSIYLIFVAEHPDKFIVVALAAGSNVTLLADQIKAFKPQLVSIKNESLVGELKEALAGSDYMPEIIPGDEGVIEASCPPPRLCYCSHWNRWLCWFEGPASAMACEDDSSSEDESFVQIPKPSATQHKPIPHSNIQKNAEQQYVPEDEATSIIE